jgi:hypothetical protein
MTKACIPLSHVRLHFPRYRRRSVTHESWARPAWNIGSVLAPGPMVGYLLGGVGNTCGPLARLELGNILF